MCGSCRKTAFTFNQAKASVVVLIPPPVDMGDAPIHIKMMISNTDNSESCSMPKALNPAVRGVTDQKKAPTNRSQ